MIKEIIKKFIPWMNVSKKIYNIYLKSHKAFKKNKKMLASYHANRIYRRYGCYISPAAEIKNGLAIPHPIGIVIGDGVKIGENCVIYQNVTIGRKYRDKPDYPEIGNNVTIYCNSTLIGNIKIGDYSTIGCNSVVLRSVDENSKCTGVVR